MTRLKVNKDKIGSQVKLSLIETIVFSDYMSESEYQYGITHFPAFFDKPKKSKKNDSDK
jgi:hypothetical protein